MIPHMIRSIKLTLSPVIRRSINMSYYFIKQILQIMGVRALSSSRWWNNMSPARAVVVVDPNKTDDSNFHPGSSMLCM